MASRLRVRYFLLSLSEEIHSVKKADQENVVRMSLRDISQ